MKEFPVVAFARQVIAMQDIIEAQAEELIRLQCVEKNYKELLNSSLQHSQHMAFGMLKLAMLPGVAKAIADAPRD